MNNASQIRVRRVYDPPTPEDGTRVLVDRVWPRGLRKDAGAFDEWCKQIAPSTELRTWYGHDPKRFAEFADRYRAELRDSDRATALAHLRKLADDGPVTLLTAATAVQISQAVVLANLLQR